MANPIATLPRRSEMGQRVGEEQADADHQHQGAELVQKVAADDRFPIARLARNRRNGGCGLRYGRRCRRRLGARKRPARGAASSCFEFVNTSEQGLDQPGALPLFRLEAADTARQACEDDGAQLPPGSGRPRRVSSATPLSIGCLGKSRSSSTICESGLCDGCVIMKAAVLSLAGLV